VSYPGKSTRISRKGQRSTKVISSLLFTTHVSFYLKRTWGNGVERARKAEIIQTGRITAGSLKEKLSFGSLGFCTISASMVTRRVILISKRVMYFKKQTRLGNAETKK